MSNRITADEAYKIYNETSTYPMGMAKIYNQIRQFASDGKLYIGIVLDDEQRVELEEICGFKCQRIYRESSRLEFDQGGYYSPKEYSHDLISWRKNQ